MSTHNICHHGKWEKKKNGSFWVGKSALSEVMLCLRIIFVIFELKHTFWILIGITFPRQFLKIGFGAVNIPFGYLLE